MKQVQGKTDTSTSILTRPVVILLLSIVITALWGSATPAIKIGYQLFDIASEDVPTKLLFAGVRFTAAGILVLLIGLMARVKVIPRKEDILPITGVGLLLTTLNYIFFYIGLTYTTGAKGSMFSATSSFFMILLSPLFFKEDRLNLQKLAGCLIGAAGLYLICFGGSDSSEMAGFHFMGEGFVLIGAIAGTFGNMLVKVVSKKCNSFMITAWQLIIGGFLLVIIGLTTGGKLYFGNLTADILLCYMAVLSSAAFSLQTLLIQYNSVSKVVFYNLLIPVFGTLLSGIFLHEHIVTLSNFLALVLVSGGIAIVNVTPRRKKEV